MSEKFKPVQDERDELAALEAKLEEKRAQVAAAENFGKYDYSVPRDDEETFSSFMESRPAEGVVRDGEGYRNAQTGAFASYEDYLNSQTSENDFAERQYENEKQYEDMSMVELARKMGEHEGDVSTSNEIMHVMGEKLDTYAEKYNWTDEQKSAHLDQLFATAEKAKGTENASEAEEKYDSEVEQNAADIKEAIKANPEYANDPAVKEKLAAIRKDLDGALDGSDEKDAREALAAAESAPDTIDEDAKKRAELAAATSAPDIIGETSSEKSEDEKRAELAAATSAPDEIGDKDVIAQRDEELSEDVQERKQAADLAAEKRERRKENLKRPDLYAISKAQVYGGSLIGRVRERLSKIDWKEKRGGKAAKALGIGVLATAAAFGAWRLGALDALINNADPDNLPKKGPTPSHNPSDYYPNGNGPVNPDNTPGVTPEIPTAKGYEYPWDWAQDVYGNDAMPKLHELGEEAAKHGYNVEWHGSGTHEWVEINGNSDSRDVITILRKFAK